MCKKFVPLVNGGDFRGTYCCTCGEKEAAHKVACAPACATEHTGVEASPTDRYLYDYKLCTAANGWAQLDTDQDAYYFGQWINPTTRRMIQYCEGDLTVITFDTDAEMCAGVAEIKAWNERQGHKFLGIDPGFFDALKAALIAAGLLPYFHEYDRSN